MKTKVKIILIIMVCVVITVTSFLTYYLIMKSRNNITSPPLDESNLQVFMDSEYYLANKIYTEDLQLSSTFNLREVMQSEFNDDEVFTSLTPEVATIDEDYITVIATGTLILRTVTDEVEEVREIFIVDGVNVIDFATFFYATEQMYATVIHRDIALINPNDSEFLINSSHDGKIFITRNYYGNGFVIDCENVLWKAHNDQAIAVKPEEGEELIIRDGHFMGLKPEENSNMILSDFEELGGIFDIDGREYVPKVTFINCIMENSHKLIAMIHSDLTVKGCILRNTSESCVSVETSTRGTVSLTIENTVMGNSVVSNVLLWCSENVTDSNNYPRVTLKGFFDSYNWKNQDNVTIVPTREFYAPLVNPFIKDELLSGSYDDSIYLETENDLTIRWMHLAIMVFSAGGSENEAIFQDEELTNLNFVKRYLPIPERFEGLINTADVIGYNKDPLLLPSAKMSDNQLLYRELRDGRE